MITAAKQFTVSIPGVAVSLGVFLNFGDECFWMKHLKPKNDYKLQLFACVFKVNEISMDGRFDDLRRDVRNMSQSCIKWEIKGMVSW